MELIYQIIHGSTCYGLNTPESDIDYKGIFIPSKRAYYTLEKGKDAYESMNSKKGECDSVNSSIEKFVSLAVNSNPNILEQLFVKPEHVLIRTVYSDMLTGIRKSFLSKRAISSYLGYATSQISRMQNMGKEATGSRLSSFQKFGYDTKNAMHLIRLLKMGVEILEEGEVCTYREKDRDELLKIRKGEYTIQEICDMSTLYREKISTLEKNSPLPDAPDDQTINDALFKIVDLYHKDAENATYLST